MADRSDSPGRMVGNEITHDRVAELNPGRHGRVERVSTQLANISAAFGYTQ
jgi:hypothetical protein